MEIDKLFNVDQVPDSLFDSVNNTVSEARALQKKKAAENAQAVIASLQKMKGDLEGKYDDLYGMLERRITSIQDGRDGIDGRDGRNGRDGKDGKDGAAGREGRDGIDGINGMDGADGISIADIRMDFDNSLIITLSNGREINAGEVLPPDITDRLKVIINQGASGGGGGGASLPDQTGNAGKFLTTDGSAASWATVAGGGGISSVASADGSVTVTTTSGAVDLSVAVAASTTNVVVQVRNATGATLTKGTAVYISGATGQIPTVTKALANADATSAQTLGLINADLSNNSNGYVTVIGLISNLDTSAYTDGQQLYLSASTAGTLTSTKPYAPSHLVYIAVVEYAHPTLGQLFVKAQNGYEMDELHNVSAQNAQNGQVLIYNQTTSLWEKAYLTAGTNVTITNAAGAITIAASGGGGSTTILENEQTIAANYAISSAKNGLSVGPVTVNTGVAVTVGTGQQWLVLN